MDPIYKRDVYENHLFRDINFEHTTKSGWHQVNFIKYNIPQIISFKNKRVSAIVTCFVFNHYLQINLIFYETINRRSQLAYDHPLFSVFVKSVTKHNYSIAIYFY